jgi:hypothetical protein
VDEETEREMRNVQPLNRAERWLGAKFDRWIRKLPGNRNDGGSVRITLEGNDLVAYFGGEGLTTSYHRVSLHMPEYIHGLVGTADTKKFYLKLEKRIHERNWTAIWSKWVVRGPAATARRE